MRPTEFSADTIIALLRKQTIASLSEVMAALGARASRRTAFRKLKDIDARTSYSHRGGFYTLDELAHFDERGLWSFAGVRFSRAGTLIATANAFVNHAEAGHFVDELDNLLGVGTQGRAAQARRRRAADAAQTRRPVPRDPLRFLLHGRPTTRASSTAARRRCRCCRANGRIPDFPVTRSHPPASWPSAANSSICRTYRKTAGEESRRRSPVANRWMRP